MPLAEKGRSPAHDGGLSPEGAAAYLSLILLLLCNVPLKLRHRLKSFPNMPVHLHATLHESVARPSVAGWITVNALYAMVGRVCCQCGEHRSDDVGGLQG